jgi:hypothetical protein
LTVSTQEIMKISLTLVNWKKIKNNSRSWRKYQKSVNYSRRLCSRAEVGEESRMRRSYRTSSALRFSKVFSRHVDFMVQMGAPKREAWLDVQELKKNLI